MKNYSIIIRSLLACLLLTTLTFCTKDTVQDQIESDSSITEDISKKEEPAPEIDSEFNTDGRLATLYPLLYAKAINPEYKLNPEKGNSPIAIPGKAVEKYIDIEKLPLEKEEIMFIKEKILNENSRAIVLENVFDPKNETAVNVIYIPYPKNIRVPEHFVHRDGLLIDDFIIHHWPWRLHRSGLERYWWNWGCFCFYVYRPFHYWDCFRCPIIWPHYRYYLEDILVDPYIYEKPFTEPIPIEKIPLGRSLFDFAH